MVSVCSAGNVDIGFEYGFQYSATGFSGSTLTTTANYGIAAAGYSVEIVVQKTFNGVALLSPHPVEITARALPDPADDEPARYIEGKIQTPKGPLTVGGIYLPNGNPIGTEKFAYKLDWMKRLARRTRDLLAREEMFVLGGDYNVCPTERDVYDPKAFASDALCQPCTQTKL